MMHVLKFNDRRIKDICKILCHGLQFGGKGKKVTTGPSDVSLNSIFFDSELSVMNVEQHDTSYDVIT